jgi:phosphoglycerate dehydrogenase-like enzyme
MHKPVVALLDVMPPASQAVIRAAFEPSFEVVFATGGSARARQQAAERAAVLLAMGAAVDADVVAAAGACKLIQKLGVGTDNIDVAAAERSGIVVLKAAGINADAVAELTVLLILAVARNLNAALAAASAGRAEKELLRAQSFQLVGKTVGVLGLGNIGRAVACRLRPFGVRLVYYDIRRLDPVSERKHGVQFVGFDELVSTSDVLSLHLPKTPETEHIIDAAVLHTVRPGVVLINTARGSLVDETALAEAIKRGQVLGVGLDVTAEEPLAASSPLRALDRVILTPHIGGAVADNFPRVIARAYRNATAVLSGQPVAPEDVVTAPTIVTTSR